MRKGSITSNNSPTLEEYDDGRSFDPTAVRFITQTWVEENMRMKEAEFTAVREATIFCGTWNVNAKKQDILLNDWLLPDGVPCADIYAIGFQEIVDLNAVNVAFDNSKSNQRKQFWQDLISSSLQTTNIKYVLKERRVMVGLLLFVFVKESLDAYISDVRSAQLGVGLMGMMGNKGGVCIRLCLYDSSICFICAHLAAHRENVVGRNNDFKNIFEKIVFTAETPYDEQQFDSGDVIRPRIGASKYNGSDITISDHDFIFWLGDLNYRIDDDIHIDEIFEKIEKNELFYLVERDQLNIERKKGNVFQDFEEGKITFNPTYKYQPGTNIYEARPEKKKRAPAWCDRVLWKCSPKTNVDLRGYNCSELLPSDHKPVWANFSCKLKTVISQKENDIFKQLMMDLEYFKSSAMPSVTISHQSLDFGKVKYHVIQSISFTITNTGSATAYWHFVSKLDETRVSKRWCAILPKRGLLFPNKNAEIEVKIKIDRFTAQRLNSGEDSLDDIVVLRIENGRDIHIPITAMYERSCYGVSLEELVCTVEPFRNTLLPVHTTLEFEPGLPTQMSGTELKQAIPKELWRLIDALWTGGALQEKDLFGETAIESEVALIREALDCGYDFPECSPHALVEALLSFLEALPEPIVPYDSLPTGPIEAPQMQTWCKRFLETLPPLNYNVFVYFLSFMREILSQSEYNRSTPARLASICIRCLTVANRSINSIAFRDGSNKEDKMKKEQRLATFESVLTYLMT